MGQWFNDLVCFYSGDGSIPGPEQWVKDSVLLQLWHRLQVWLRVNSWPLCHFPMPLGLLEEKKKKACTEQCCPLEVLSRARIRNLFLKEPESIYFRVRGPKRKIGSNM